jgi:hypothetical protein
MGQIRLLDKLESNEAAEAEGGNVYVFVPNGFAGLEMFIGCGAWLAS